MSCGRRRETTWPKKASIESLWAEERDDSAKKASTESLCELWAEERDDSESGSGL